MWKYNNTDELYHHGILGMKWGIRRFQNRNGSLTSRGKKRRMSQDAIEAKKLRKKKLYEMSNDEIKTLNKRRQLETDYKRLNKGAIATGLAIAGGTAAALGTYGAIRNNGGTLIKDGKTVVNAVRNFKIK